MREQEIYQAAIDTFGVDSQIDMLFEEMAEVAQALCKLKRRKNGSLEIDNVHEELADLSIVLEQMYIIFDREKIMAHKALKLLRLEERINNYSPPQAPKVKALTWKEYRDIQESVNLKYTGRE